MKTWSPLPWSLPAVRTASGSLSSSCFASVASASPFHDFHDIQNASECIRCSGLQILKCSISYSFTQNSFLSWSDRSVEKVQKSINHTPLFQSPIVTATINPCGSTLLPNVQYVDDEKKPFVWVPGFTSSPLSLLVFLSTSTCQTTFHGFRSTVRHIHCVLRVPT